MNCKQVPNSMLAPNLGAKDPLFLLMHKSANTQPDKSYSKDELYWNADHYRLTDSSYFRSLSAEKKHLVLHSLNHKSLSLSYYIEKFGLNYGAKMILNAESSEEKSLYALFSADEVKHRLWLEKFIQQDVFGSIDFHPLLRSLELCLQEGTKNSMVFTIQVILEGFGLFHYGNLKESCLNLELKKAFSDILKDEVLHHGMGVVLTQKMALDDDTKKQVFDLTSRFVRSLLEAEWVLKTLKENTEGLTEQQVNTFKLETRWHEQLNFRVEKIKSLIKKVGYAGLSDELDSKGIFRIND